MTVENRPDTSTLWAESGDKIAPTTPEVAAGWPLTNVPPSRQRFNWFFNWVAKGIRYILQRGLPEWSSTEDYPVSAVVMYNHKAYKAKTAGVNKIPDVSPNDWEYCPLTAAEQLLALPISPLEEATAAEISAGANKVVTADDLLSALQNIGLGGISALRVGTAATGQAEMTVNSTYVGFNVNKVGGGSRGLAVLNLAKNQLVLGSTDQAERVAVSLGGEDGFGTPTNNWWCYLPGNLILATGIAEVPPSGIDFVVPGPMTNILVAVGNVQNPGGNNPADVQPVTTNPYNGNRIAITHTASTNRIVSWIAFGKV